MTTELVPRAFTVSEYHRMVETGILDSDERVELLDGVIVSLSPIGVPHWMRETRIRAYLGDALKHVAMVPGTLSIPLGEYNEPEPDLAVLADLAFDTLGRPPDPSEIYAMIEISDSSLERDTKMKHALYARFMIADYLVVDLAADRVVHFSHPDGGDYRSVRRLGRGDVFTLAALPAIALKADPFLST